MEVRETSIAGLLLFVPAPFRDDRGFFSRTFDVDIARRQGVDPNSFVQDSVSRSRRGVIRGMHLRAGAGEAKLVRCSYGEIFDVVVDLRPQSPTYLQQASFRLTDHSCQSIYVPAGCAHGFQALTDPADVAYRIDRAHDSAEDVTIAFDDPQLSIQWPLPPTVLSDRDRRARQLAEVLARH
jgi:dTDP-4-dehydrorhamnose 3,5-epimerase